MISSNTNRVIIITALVLVIIGICIAYTNSFSAEITNDYINIKGLFGTKIKMADIQSIEKISNLPFFMMKTTGINLGIINVGKFTVPNIGKSTIYQVNWEKPYLLIRCKERNLILGFGTNKNDEIFYKIQEIL